MRRELVEIGLRHGVQEQRQRRFRQDDETRVARADHAAVGFERRPDLVVAPLHFLRDIALQQADDERLALGLRPVDLLQSVAAGQDSDQDE